MEKVNAQIRVLVVDDVAEIRDVLMRKLSQAGLLVVTVGTVAEARTYLETESFDVVLTDVHFPEEDGFALLDWVQTHCDQIPVYLMSGNPLIKHSIQKNGRRAAAGVFLKPFDFPLMIAKLSAPYDRTSTILPDPVKD